jgi:bla regulator protein BlaR1
MSRLLDIGLANAAMAAILALVAIIVDRLARRPALGHVLWLLVLLKLVSPPLVGVNVAGSVVREPATGAVGANPDGATLESWANRPLSSLRLDEFEPKRTETAPSRTAEPKARWAAAAGLLRRLWDPDGPGRRFVIGAWLAGSVLWFVTAAVRIARFLRLLSHAKPAPESLQWEVQDLAERLGLARCPEVVVLPVRVPPHLWAMGGPARLVLPAELLKRLDRDERATLLAHELAHFGRRDHLVRLLELVAVGLYWWHPAAWWARRELNKAEERCCDARVVGSLPGAARAYAKALLKTVEFLSEARTPLPVAASGAGTIPSLRRRISMILHGPTIERLSGPTRAGALLLGLLILPLAPRGLTASPPQEPGRDAPAADRSSSRESADLDRRMRRLEQQIERLTESLRSGDEPRSAREPRPARRAEPSRTPTRGDEERRAKEIEEAVKKSIDPKKMEAMAKEIEEAVKKSIDPKAMEEMGKRIEEAVKKGVDPKAMERMGREIEEAVKKSIDPKKMEQLGRQIEESVKKGIDLDRLKSLERLGEQVQGRARQQAEEAQGRAEQAARSFAEAARQREQSARQREQSSRQREERTREAEPRREDRELRELDRRLRRLEELLERTLESRGRDRSRGEDRPEAK